MLAGGLVIEYGAELLKRTGDWMWEGVKFRSFARDPLTLVGAALILYGFVVAYRIARPELVGA